MNTKMKLLSLGLTLTVAGALASPATAGHTMEGVREATVSFADLNLTQPEGVAKLYTRLKVAAVQVCRPAIESQLADRLRAQDCRASALARAVAAIAVPELSRYHAANTGKRDSAEIVAGKF
jgi:UrcA family protein